MTLTMDGARRAEDALVQGTYMFISIHFIFQSYFMQAAYDWHKTKFLISHKHARALKI